MLSNDVVTKKHKYHVSTVKLSEPSTQWETLVFRYISENTTEGNETTGCRWDTLREAIDGHAKMMEICEHLDCR
jgi:hypothetical protein